MSYTKCETHGVQINVCKLCAIETARAEGEAAERERCITIIREEMWSDTRDVIRLIETPSPTEDGK